VSSLLCLFHIEVPYWAMISEEVTSSEKLSDEVDVSLILEESEVLKLKASY